MNEKVKHIVERFGMTDLDSATLNMGNVLCHYRQERLPEPETIPVYEQIVYEVSERLSRGPYQRPVVECRHFAYLLTEIGKYFGHECNFVEAKPDYLEGGLHFLVHDVTAGKYRDGSIYKGIMKGGHLLPIEESGIDRNDIPADMLNIVKEL